MTFRWMFHFLRKGVLVIFDRKWLILETNAWSLFVMKVLWNLIHKWKSYAWLDLLYTNLRRVKAWLGQCLAVNKVLKSYPWLDLLYTNLRRVKAWLGQCLAVNKVLKCVRKVWTCKTIFMDLRICRYIRYIRYNIYNSS